jgi:hypothetical protein
MACHETSRLGSLDLDRASTANYSTNLDTPIEVKFLLRDRWQEDV